MIAGLGWFPVCLMGYFHLGEWPILGCVGSMDWIGPSLSFFSRIKNLDDVLESMYILETGVTGFWILVSPRGSFFGPTTTNMDDWESSPSVDKC